MYSSIPLSAHYWLFVLSTHHLQFRQDTGSLVRTVCPEKRINAIFRGCEFTGGWVVPTAFVKLNILELDDRISGYVIYKKGSAFFESISFITSR